MTNTPPKPPQPMAFGQYQTRALSTAFYPHVMEGGHPHAMAYIGLKLNGEAGEAAEKLGKFWREEGELTHLTKSARLDLLDEVGDVLWYCAAIASECGVSLNTVAAWNLEKLAARSKYGKDGWTDERKYKMLKSMFANREGDVDGDDDHAGAGSAPAGDHSKLPG